MKAKVTSQEGPWESRGYHDCEGSWGCGVELYGIAGGTAGREPRAGERGGEGSKGPGVRAAVCVVGEGGRSGHGGHHRHSSPWPYGFTETWEDTLHPQSNRTASGLLPVPAPTLGFILRERVPSELLSGCGCGLLCCSPPPPPL